MTINKRKLSYNILFVGFTSYDYTLRISTVALRNLSIVEERAKFYFLALNSGSVFAGNDISAYPVTGIGFVFGV